MDKYIYVKKESLSKKCCENIIELFEKDTSRYEGVTHSGLNKHIKNTTDLVIKNEDEKWKDIHDILALELQTTIKLYITNLYEDSFEDKYTYFKNTNLVSNNFMVQRYIKKHGKYIYHHDFHKNKEGHRVITFLWYLNTIEDGGETEFWGNYKIKPEQGKLLFFPACWSYPHCGNIPVSDNKYIVTGWLYENDNLQIKEIQDKFIQRYNHNVFFSETECEWLITEMDKYYKMNTIQLNHVLCHSLSSSVSDFMAIKSKFLVQKLKEYYTLSDEFILNVKNVNFVKEETINNNVSNENENTCLFKFYIPLSENIEFYMNDNTIKNIVCGNLFLFSEKNVNYKSNGKYYLCGSIETI